MRVSDTIDAMLEVRQPKSFEYRAAYMDAILDLLARLRQIDVDMLESEAAALEQEATNLRLPTWTREAKTVRAAAFRSAANALQAKPLLPSDGPPEREGR